jgi:hypothetical protein
VILFFLFSDWFYKVTCLFVVYPVREWRTHPVTASNATASHVFVMPLRFNNNSKHKGKIHLRTGHEGPEGE